MPIVYHPCHDLDEANVVICWHIGGLVEKSKKTVINHD